MCFSCAETFYQSLLVLLSGSGYLLQNNYSKLQKKSYNRPSQKLTLSLSSMLRMPKEDLFKIEIVKNNSTLGGGLFLLLLTNFEVISDKVLYLRQEKKHANKE